jgi:predicted ester cyclase
MMLGIPRTGMYSMTDMLMMLGYFGPVNQILQEEYITIVIDFFKIFPDNHLINYPYKILIAEGDYTCSVADFSGTFKGPMKGLDGKMIQPTNKKYHLEFCTIAHWKDGKILEERLFYDQMGMLKQIGAI